MIEECEGILEDIHPHEYYNSHEDDFDIEVEAYSEVKQNDELELDAGQNPALSKNTTEETVGKPQIADRVEHSEKAASTQYAKRPNSYDICQSFLRKHSVRNCGGLLYVYKGPCYVLLTQDIAKGMILDSSREEIGKYGNSDILSQVYEFLRAETSIRVADDCEDSSYVVFKNGRLNLDTGEFEKNNPDVFAITYLNFDYSRKGECPTFQSFLDRISGGNTKIQKRIWEVIGYCWSADMKAKSFFVFIGPSGTGKTTLLRLIQSGLVMNEGEVTISIHELSGRFALANLAGKHLISDGDMGANVLSMQDVAAIKNLTGLNSVRSESKGVDAVSVRPTAKLILLRQLNISNVLA